MIDWLDLTKQMSDLIKWNTYKRFLIDFFVVYLQFNDYKYKYFANKKDIIERLLKNGKITNSDIDYINEKIDNKYKSISNEFLMLEKYLNKRSKNWQWWIDLFNFLSNNIQTEKNLRICKKTQQKNINNYIENLWELDLSFVLSVLNLKWEVDSFIDVVEYFLNKNIQWLKNKGILVSIDLDYRSDGDIDIIIYHEYIDIEFSSENWYENPNNITSYNLVYNTYKLLKEQNESFFDKDLFKFLEN